jgi:hypothetical protein
LGRKAWSESKEESPDAEGEEGEEVVAVVPAVVKRDEGAGAVAAADGEEPVGDDEMAAAGQDC